MPDLVSEVLITEAALRKLGARGISAGEVEQVPRNRHVMVRNPSNPSRGGEGGKRRLMIGRTNGGRLLTLVVERTLDPTTWLVVTGWRSTDTERKLLSSQP